MCVQACQESVINHLSRRDFLKAAAVLLAAGAAAPAATSALAGERPGDTAHVFGRPFHRVVDLTHTLWPDFPTFSGQRQLELEVLVTFPVNGYNANRWLLAEHTGTHMDAPFHFSLDQDTADEIPISKLLLPLVVVDIRAKAAQNPDAQVTPDDLAAWERRYGRIPENACVAMLSGWAERLFTPEFRNADANGVMHFPGFHVDAANFLIQERNAGAIAVDTLSLDFGMSADFATHYLWLGSNRWGMENVANLDKLPPKGCTIFAGGPKIQGASGGPSRVIALVHSKK
jgi:kynurenine formamidase